MTQPKQTVAALGATVDDQRERTDFLKTVIAVVLVGALASLVFQRIVTPDQTVRMAGPLLIIGAALAARYLMALGRYRAALNLMVAGAWIAVTTVVALTNGLQAPMVVAYPLLILATGWLMGPGAAIRMASVTIALTVCLFLAERFGFLVLLAKTPPGLRGGVQIFIYVIATVLVVFTLRVMQRRQDRLDQVHRELMRRTVELEASQAELRAAQVVANIGSWVYDVAGDAMQFSAETCRIIGLAQGAVLSRNAYLAHIHPDDRTALQQAWQAAFEGAVLDIEYRVAVGEDLRWIRSKGEVKFAADGSPASVLGIAQDITERKRSEAALIAAKAEAEQANRAKSSFLTAVSHDLGQPISALSLLVGVLEQSAAVVPKKLVQNMQECVRGITALLTDLVAVSRLDAGVVSPTPSDWSVNELLTAAIAVHAVEAQAKGVRLRVRATEVWTTADRRLVQRMVGNLVSNAIRYTDKGGVLVVCRRHAGRHWIEVWDTGIGIAQDKQGLVFEEFAQLNSAERFVGSGLGLSIVAKTAQLLGLQVRLRSTLGKGSMFAVELPPRRNGER